MKNARNMKVRMMNTRRWAFAPIPWRAATNAKSVVPLLAVLLAGCGGTPEWSSDEVRAIEALREISKAQDTFQKGCYLDADFDGIGDYGTLEMLADPDGQRGVPPLMNPLYTTERAGIYELYVRVVLGEGEETPPRWECFAFPPDSESHCFFVDTSGVIRFADRREAANQSSPPVPEIRADA